MPLQGGGFVGDVEPEDSEQVALVGGDAAGAGDGLALDLDAVMLDLTQQCQRTLWREWMPAGAEALARNAMQEQREEADQRMRAGRW